MLGRFNAHQNTLSLHTSFGFSESKGKVVTIGDHSAHAIWRFLKYCYTGDCSDAPNGLALGEGWIRQ